MAVPYKPHSFAVYAPSADTDADNRVEVTTWDDAPTTVTGMIEPISSTVAYEQFAVEVARALRLFADVDKASYFPLGALVHCASRSQWGKVVAPPLVYDAEPRTSHIVVALEQCRPTGAPI